MKHYIQEGTSLKRADLTRSDYVCKCCEPYVHAGSEEHTLLEDDVPCDECGALCACICHREIKEDPMSLDSLSPLPSEETEEKVEEPA